MNIVLPTTGQVFSHSRRLFSMTNYLVAVVTLFGVGTAFLLQGCAGNIVNADLGAQVVPSILTQPVSQTVLAGQNVGFGVSVGGNPPFNFQWYMNGQAVEGATSNTYLLQAVSVAQSGSKFYVTVTDTSGTTQSATATLTVTATGNGGIAGGGSAGAGSASLICNPTTPAFGGQVTLLPTFTSGTAQLGSSGTNSSDISTAAISGKSYNSAPVTGPATFTLTVTGLNNGSGTTVETCKASPTTVAISGIQPNGTTIAPGTQSFTANVTGGATDTLKWSASGGSFSGNVWTTPTTPGTYTITATSADNPAVHSNVNIVISAPAITKQPSDVALCSGAAGTLAVTANYASAYQWLLNGVPILGATASSYLIPSASSTDAGKYAVNVISPAGTVTSQTVTVTVGSAIAANPANTTVALQQSASFSVSATGKSPFAYQWYVQPTYAASFAAIPGATASSYTTPVASDFNGNQYQATVKDGCGTVFTTSAAVLSVSNIGVPPIITLQPFSEAVPIGGTYTLHTNTISGSPVSYQWFRLPVGSTTAQAIPGATSIDYTVPSSATNQSNDQDGYYEVATNASGVDVSTTALLTVGSGIYVPVEGQPITVSESAGETAVFSINASSSLPLTYQWYSAPPGSAAYAAIPGATSSSYTIPSTTTDQNGSTFYVVVSNGATQSITSAKAGLWVSQLPVVTNLCDSWTSLGYATPQASCGYELVPAKANVTGGVMWPHVVPTANMQLNFTVSISNASETPGEGFALVIGDPSSGATPKTLGSGGLGLGAQGIPGFATTFNVDNVPGAPLPPFLATTGSTSSQWANPWIDINNTLATLAAPGSTITHTFNVSILNGNVDITMDGVQVFHGGVALPPVAYLYFTAANGTNFEQVNVGNLTAIFSPQ